MFDGDKSDLRPLERRDDRGPVSQISADGAVEAMTSRYWSPGVARHTKRRTHESRFRTPRADVGDAVTVSARTVIAGVARCSTDLRLGCPSSL